jgi:hypothetical protein
MAKKKHDPQAKAKRQKMIAAVGGVILLGLLAFQLPRTLKLLHPSNATASASQAAPAPTTPAATPVGGATATSGTAAATSADGLTDPGTAISPQSGQLLAFSRFRSKDPFAQQLKLDCATGQGGDCSAGSGSTSTGSGPGHGGSGGATGATGSTGGVTQPPVSGSPPAKPTSAQISVNGAGETVSVGAQFPASSPVFVLVSLKPSSAKIAIAGGTLQGGGTVTLKKGRPLTLMNTADGTRYVLRLVSVS